MSNDRELHAHMLMSGDAKSGPLKRVEMQPTQELFTLFLIFFTTATEPLIWIIFQKTALWLSVYRCDSVFSTITSLHSKIRGILYDRVSFAANFFGQMLPLTYPRGLIYFSRRLWNSVKKKYRKFEQWKIIPNNWNTTDTTPEIDAILPRSATWSQILVGVKCPELW